MIPLQIILIAIGSLLADATDCNCDCDGKGVCAEQKALRTEVTDFTKWNRYFDFVRRMEKNWQNEVSSVVKQQLEWRTSETMEKLKNDFIASQKRGSGSEDQTTRIESVETSLRALNDRAAELDLTMEMISREIEDLRTKIQRVQRVPKCGIDIDNGVNNRGANSNRSVVWPWMAALYRNTSEYYCDGSVIHRHFILTGAECAIHFRNQRLTVKLGLSDLKNGAHLQEYQVHAAHIHPEFKRGPGEYDNLDYDVALLEVEEPISFGPFVRPVCLPPREMPQDQPFLQPQSSSKVVHLDSYIKSPETASPTVLNLPVLSREECRKEIKDRRWNVYFPSRYFTFCGEGAIKCPFRGSPVIQSRLEGGTRTWTQVAIQSLCLNTIIFGTRLDHLRAWVDSIIEPDLKQ